MPLYYNCSGSLHAMVLLWNYTLSGASGGGDWRFWNVDQDHGYYVYIDDADDLLLTFVGGECRQIQKT